MAETPLLIRTPSGYPQQSPWLSIANKQLEVMARFMAELGMTPASRSRVNVGNDPRMMVSEEPIFTTIIEHVAAHGKRLGMRVEEDRAIEDWAAKHCNREPG